ncbi:MAG: energy transducer TonB [Azoarcus sp.]|jgi:protein TonB|nr:energy transducer TonB [Azoarcus sp.]
MKSLFSRPAAAFLLFLFAACAPAAAAPPPGADKAAAMAEEARMRELQAEVERRMREYEQRLRRKHIGGEVTEPRFIKYLASFRRKIACSSLRHYPEAARGKIYGKLVITVSILADGSFEKARISHSSGHKILDEAAINIARQAAPYDPFPPEIRRDADALDISRTWTFTFTEEQEGETPETDANTDPCA